MPPFHLSCQAQTSSERPVYPRMRYWGPQCADLRLAATGCSRSSWHHLIEVKTASFSRNVQHFMLGCAEWVAVRESWFLQVLEAKNLQCQAFRVALGNASVAHRYFRVPLGAWTSLFRARQWGHLASCFFSLRLIWPLKDRPLTGWICLSQNLLTRYDTYAKMAPW